MRKLRLSQLSENMLNEALYLHIMAIVSLLFESILICLSCWGYSQDGNGFKTSTMRLGADVIVFSRASRER